jgi:hypothetical protein
VTHNRPLCPDGHGEMEIADDRLPIEQAITQTAERIDATTQRLPFPSPPFNYEGVLHALCEKRHTIAALEKRVEDRRDLLKKAKDDLDEANAELGKMLDRFERDEQDRLAEIARREAAAAAGHPEDTTLVRCAWELAHPDEGVSSLLQSRRSDRRGLRGYRARQCAAHRGGRTIRPSTADERARRRAQGRRAHRHPGSHVGAWSVEDRAAVLAWAGAPDGSPRPAILGTAHVAADFTTSEAVPGETFQNAASVGLDFSATKPAATTASRSNRIPPARSSEQTAPARKNRRATRSAGRKRRSHEALTVRPARREASHPLAATARGGLQDAAGECPDDPSGGSRAADGFLVGRSVRHAGGIRRPRRARAAENFRLEVRAANVADAGDVKETPMDIDPICVCGKPYSEHPVAPAVDGFGLTDLGCVGCFELEDLRAAGLPEDRAPGA